MIKKALNPSSQKEEKIIKQPLFKMFMNNNKRKLHLVKNNKSNSKDSSKSNTKFDNNDKNQIHPKNMHLNLQLFSYKILEAKHNSTPELFLKKRLNILIKKKKSHLLADFNERALTGCQYRDFLKRYYTYKETEERIPKYVSYYKNYLTFFCRPFFTSYIINKKMVKHMEKVAQIFYNENYADDKEGKEETPKKKREKNILIFSKKILKEIDNVDIYTVVTSEAAMKQIQKLNSLVNKNNQENFKNNNKIKNIDVNINNNKIKNESNSEKIKINELSIYDNNYKITPIKSPNWQKEKRINSSNSFDEDYPSKLDKNKIISELKNQDLIPSTTNSINLLIEEMQPKEEKNNNEKLNEDTEKDSTKNIHKNCIVIQGGKTTNHINININHLTIGEKTSPKKDEKSNKKEKKISDGLDSVKNSNSKNKKIKKFRNINSNINQKISSEIKNEINYIKEKEKEKKEKKNCVLTLPPPTHNASSRANYTLYKKLNQVFPKTINNNHLKQNKNIKYKNLFNIGYNGTVTNLHKYISFGKGKGDSRSHKQLSKQTLNTNYSSRLSNIFKNINYMTSKTSKNINIISSRSPEVLSGERTRSISSMKNNSKRIIYSSLRFNGSNLQLLNLKNSIGTTKNSEKRLKLNGKEFIEFKKINTNNEKIPLIKNIEDKTKYTKIVLKLNGKNLNLQKLLNAFPKKTQKSRSTDNLI